MKSIGAKGYLLKSSGLNELNTAIQSVLAGKQYFSMDLQTQKNKDIHSDDHKDVSLDKGDRSKLKKRELLFFPWIASKGNFVII